MVGVVVMGAVIVVCPVHDRWCGMVAGCVVVSGVSGVWVAVIGHVPNHPGGACAPVAPMRSVCCCGGLVAGVVPCVILQGAFSRISLSLSLGTLLMEMLLVHACPLLV